MVNEPKKFDIVVGAYVGPTNVNWYGYVPPVDDATDTDPLLKPHVVSTVVAVISNNDTLLTNGQTFAVGISSNQENIMVACFVLIDN